MDRRLIKQIAETIRQADRHKTHAYDTVATVVRVEGGTAWVHIPGGVAETPVRMTVDAKAGDTVQVRVSNGRAHLTGNATAPPTDNTLAEKVRGGLKATDKVVKAVKDTAEKAKRIATSTAQYFWVSTGGTDNGAHVTSIPQSEFEADPQNGGGNTLMTSNGVAVRDGLTELATFSANGSRVGASGNAYVETDATGVSFGDGDGEHMRMENASNQFFMRGEKTVFVETSEAKETGSQTSTTTATQGLSETTRGDARLQSSFLASTVDYPTDSTLQYAEAELLASAYDPVNGQKFVRLSLKAGNGSAKALINNSPIIVKDTFSDLNKSANTYYYQKTFNVAKSGYTPIAFNPYTNHATEAACMVNYNSSAGDATVTVMSRNNTISGLNLYLDVTYARNELL